MKNRLIIWMSLLLGVSACEETIIPEDAADNPQAVFDALWTFTDEYYCYFDLKGVDWDSVRTVYQPRISHDMSNLELLEVLGSMLNTLRDGHTDLSTPLRDSFYDNSLLYPRNFDFGVIARNYLVQGEAPTYASYSGFRVAMLPGNILYLYYGSFSNPTSPLVDILEDFPNSNGMILDVRNNGGGSEDPVMAGYFTNTEKLVGYYAQKNGPARDAFTDRLSVRVQPGEIFYDQKVAILTNRSSYSATTLFCQYMKVFDDVIQVGDTTGGGAGSPLDYDLPNGWTVRVSTSPHFGVDGANYEEGVPPDIAVMDDPITLEVDEIIERALEELRQ